MKLQKSISLTMDIYFIFKTKQSALNSVQNTRPLVKKTMAELILNKFYLKKKNYKVEKTKNILGIPLTPLKE